MLTAAAHIPSWLVATAGACCWCLLLLLLLLLHWPLTLLPPTL
jgi:hypothetical protein